MSPVKTRSETFQERKLHSPTWDSTHSMNSGMRSGLASCSARPTRTSRMGCPCKANNALLPRGSVGTKLRSWGPKGAPSPAQHSGKWRGKIQQPHRFHPRARRRSSTALTDPSAAASSQPGTCARVNSNRALVLRQERPASYTALTLQILGTQLAPLPPNQPGTHPLPLQLCPTLSPCRRACRPHRWLASHSAVVTIRRTPPSTADARSATVLACRQRPCCSVDKPAFCLAHPLELHSM